MQATRNKYYHMNIHYLNIIMFPIIIAIALFVQFNAKHFFKPSIIDISSKDVVYFAHWLVLFILIFLIISTLYFFRTLSQVLDSSLTEKYFWTFNIIVSIIISNLIYIYLHPIQVPLKTIIQIIQVYFLIILNIYAIYFCFFTCGILSALNKINGILTNYLIDELVNQTSETVFRLIFDPFNIIAILLTLILKYNPLGENTIDLPGIGIISLDMQLTGFGIIDNILIFLCVIILILLASLIGELIFEILILGPNEYRYKPIGVSKKLRTIILGLIATCIKAILKPVIDFICAKLSLSLFWLYSITQAIVIPSIWMSDDLDINWKIILSLISIFAFSILFYSLGPGSRLRPTEIIMGSLSIQVGFLIIAIPATLIYYIILEYRHITEIITENMSSCGFICILISALLLIIFIDSLNPYHTPATIKSTGNMRINIRINRVRTQNGGQCMYEEYQVNIKWGIDKKDYVLFAVDSSAAMLRFSDENRKFSSKIAKEIQDKLNLSETGDKTGLICWRDQPINTSSTTDFIIDKDEIINILNGENEIRGRSNFNKVLERISQLCKGDSDIEYLVVLITNGFVEDDGVLDYDHNEAMTLFSGKANIQIYTIGIHHPQKIVIDKVLKPLASLTHAEYIQIDEENKITETLSDLVDDLGFDFEIIVKLPHDIYYQANSAIPSSLNVETIENKNLLKWNSRSLNSTQEIKFNIRVDYNEGKIYKKPRFEVESKYIAKYGRKLTFDQTMIKVPK